MVPDPKKQIDHLGAIIQIPNLLKAKTSLSAGLLIFDSHNRNPASISNTINFERFLFF